MRNLLIAGVILSAGLAKADELAEQGKPAPMFRLPVYNPKEAGQPVVGLDRWVGPDPREQGVRAVLISFMASFCGPCKKEMPYLQSLHEKYRDQGLRVVMVAIDADDEGQKKVSELIAKNAVTFPVMKDRFNIVARRWLGTQSPLPSLFMLKPDGTVASVHRGYSDDASQVIAAEVTEALKK